MSQDLQLLGRAPRTHDGYLREIRKLACHFGLSPDQLGEQQIADYLLHLINDKHFAPGSLKVSYSAMKFFFSVTCPRDWDVLNKIKVPKQKTLPTVMTIGEVHRLTAATKRHHNAALLWTLYSLALRNEEGLNLETSDIDSERMTAHIHRGKGAKDRLLPLPHSTLQVLRNHWKQHRNTRLIFPANGRNRKSASQSAKPMNASTIQGALVRAKLWQSPLPKLPERQASTLAGQTNGPVAAGAILPGYLHGSWIVAESRAQQPACLLQGVV